MGSGGGPPIVVMSLRKIRVGGTRTWVPRTSFPTAYYVLTSLYTSLYMLHRRPASSQSATPPNRADATYRVPATEARKGRWGVGIVG